MVSSGGVFFLGLFFLEDIEIIKNIYESIIITLCMK